MGIREMVVEEINFHPKRAEGSKKMKKKRESLGMEKRKWVPTDRERVGVKRIFVERFFIKRGGARGVALGERGVGWNSTGGDKNDKKRESKKGGPPPPPG